MKIKRINVTELLFVLSMGIALIHQFETNVVPNYVKYGVALFWIAFWLVKQKKIRRYNWHIVKLYILPIVLIAIVSIIFFLINPLAYKEEHYLSSLLSHTVYGLLRCVVVLAIISLFRERAFKMMFRSLTLSGVIILLYCGINYGFDSLIRYCFTGVFSAVANGLEWQSNLWHIGLAMEVHDNTFAFGLFFIYYLFICNDQKERHRGIVISTVFIYLGLKRVEILAIVCVAIILLLKKAVKLNTLSFVKLITVVYLCFSLIFIWILKNETWMLGFLDVHRVKLYEFLASQIQYLTIVVGKGFSAINNHLMYYQQGINELLTSSHSDLARMFIELGGVCFCFWILYYLYFLPKNFLRITKDKQVCEIAFLCQAFLFITYFIDNTLELFASQIMCMMIPAGMCMLRSCDNEILRISRKR